MDLIIRNSEENIGNDNIGVESDANGSVELRQRNIARPTATRTKKLRVNFE